MERLVRPEKRAVIEAALRETGEGPLKPVKERLGDAYSYNEIRLVSIAMVLGLS